MDQEHWASYLLRKSREKEEGAKGKKKESEKKKVEIKKVEIKKAGGREYGVRGDI